MQIKQFVRLTSWGSVYNRTFPKATKYYDGIGANDSTNGFTRYLEIPLAEVRNEVFKHTYTDFAPMDGLDQYLAETLQPTTTGLHLNITYQLSIKMEYDIYCSNHPT